MTDEFYLFFATDSYSRQIKSYVLLLYIEQIMIGKMEKALWNFRVKYWERLLKYIQIIFLILAVRIQRNNARHFFCCMFIVFEYEFH